MLLLWTDLRRGVGSKVGSGATFADAAIEYLRFVEQVRRIDSVTVKDYRGVIDGYLTPAFGDQPIDAITPDLIDAYKEKLIVEQPLSNQVIVRHLTVLHGVFKRAGRVWGLARNPAAADLVERPKVVYSGEFDTLDRDELEALAAAAHDRQDAAIYLTAAYTGLRQGELLGLRSGYVDFVGGLVHVRRNYTGGREKSPKGKRVRSVPIMPRVADALARPKDRGYLTDDNDLVFRGAPRLVGAPAPVLQGARGGRFAAHPLPRSAPPVRLAGDHGARPVRGAVVHGPPALLDHAALPAPQAKAPGRTAATGRSRRPEPSPRMSPEPRQIRAN